MDRRKWADYSILNVADKWSNQVFLKYTKKCPRILKKMVR